MEFSGNEISAIAQKMNKKRILSILPPFIETTVLLSGIPSS